VIRIENNTIAFDGREMSLEYPIHDARVVGDRLLVLFRPESKRSGQFRNLVAFDLHGQKLWTAELPTSSGADAYYEIVSENPIVADSYCSYRCTIDRDTGRITSKEFHK
jgi:hypothetical protein